MLLELGTSRSTLFITEIDINKQSSPKKEEEEEEKKASFHRAGTTFHNVIARRLFSATMCGSFRVSHISRGALFDRSDKFTLTGTRPVSEAVGLLSDPFVRGVVLVRKSRSQPLAESNLIHC